MTGLGAAKRALLVKGGTYVASSAASQAIMLGAWSALPWLAHPSVLGQFALLSLVTDLLTRFVLLGTDSAIVRFYVEPERQSQVFTAALAWLAIAAVVAALALAATVGVIPRLIGVVSAVYESTVWIVFASAVANAVASIVLAHHVGRGAARSFARLMLAKSIVTAAGFVITGVMSLGVQGLLGAQLAGGLIVGLAALGRGHVLSGRIAAPTRSMLREIAGYGLPLTLYAAISLMIDYSGRLMLGRTSTLATVGVFQFYFQIASQANGVWTSLNRAWSPHMFERLERDRPSALRQVTRLISIAPAAYALGLAVLLLVLASEIPQRILPPAYGEHVALLALLLLGPLYTAIYTITYPLFYFEKNTIRVSVIQSVLGLVTVGSTVVLTTRFGVQGAVLGWVLGAFLAPLLYMGGAPHIAAESGPVLRVHLWWGIAGTGLWYAVVGLGSFALGAAVLVAVAVLTNGRALWSPRPAPQV